MASADQKIQNKLRDWLFHPDKFVREALRVEKISQQQFDGLEHYRRILTAKLKRANSQPMTAQEEDDANKIGLSIMSGHGTGKDAFASWVILHFLTTRPFCKIPCTAPVGPQLKTVLWSEIHKWLRQSILSDYIVWQAEKVYFKEAQGREWFCIPRTINPKAGAEEQAETIAGFHEDNLLFVIDEASGVPDPVYRPIEGGLTGKVNFVLIIFNPTQNHGYALETQTKHRRDWLCLQWNAEESDLVDAAQLERMARKYGKDSNAYRVRVLGMPPLATPDTLIPWEWVMAAVNREIEVGVHDPTVLGIDVARQLGGDESVILRSQGMVVPGLETYNGVNTQELAYWALKEIQEREAACAAIDVIGWGAGTYDVLKDMAPCPILPVNVAETPENADLFSRKRDELWWHIRERFQDGTIKIPHDDILIGELSTIRYNFSRTAKEKIKIESKQELRDRGLDSPNRADALLLAEVARRYVVPSYRQQTRNWRQERPAAWVG